MSESGLSEKQLKKRESNKKYREKIKQKLEEPKPLAPAQEPPVPSTEPRAPSPEPRAPSPEPDLDPEEEDIEDKLVIDKQAYLYLLEKARQNETIEKPEPKPEEKRVEKKPSEQVEEDRSSFFFQLKNSFKTTAISLIPVLTMQLAVHGGRFLTSSTNNSRSKPTSSQQSGQPELSTMDYGLPAVNAL